MDTAALTASTAPATPAELQQIIDLHRDMFGGWTMMADEAADSATTSPASQPQDGAPQPPASDARDEQLGDGGKKALDAERRRARDLEKALKAANDKLAVIEDAEKTEPAASHRRRRQGPAGGRERPSGACPRTNRPQARAQ